MKVRRWIGISGPGTIRNGTGETHPIKLLHCLARTLPRLREPTVSNYYRRCYYPGSTLMSIVCWCKHPISAARRAEAEFNAGWNWPDPDDIAFRIG